MVVPTHAQGSGAERTTLKLLTFDADGTLFDLDRTLRLALEEARSVILARTGLPPHTLDIAAMIADRDAVARSAPASATLVDIRRAGIRQTLVRLGIQDVVLAQTATDAFFARRFGQMDLYPDVKAALDALRSRFTLALISNGNSDPERSELAGYFAVRVFASNGVAKPDLRMFEEALHQTGVAPSDAAHIGDSLEEDVAPAQHLGMLAVWLNRSGAPNGTDITPDVQISTLQQMLTLPLGLE
ncbi:MAG: HAD family hydrolase, partial [Chloroflexi bacterium]|nr:HAD family hydrolase [Chloroflexota bacterium]